MSQIEGRISVDVQFTDSTTTTGVQSMKKLSLASANDYSSGRVAIITGTCSTAVLGIDIIYNGYKDASGDEVLFGGGTEGTTSQTVLSRLAFSASGPSPVIAQGTIVNMAVASRANQVAVSDVPLTLNGAAEDTLEVYVLATAGTASFTLILWGDS